MLISNKQFPPYELADRDLVEQAEERTRKLARIYHVAQDQAWDGKKVLAELVQTALSLDPETREHYARQGRMLLELTNRRRQGQESRNGSSGGDGDDVLGSHG